eukprot:scaffold1330_cov240-Pinguiococcus_pyrenoidosus.AAC.35
MTFRVADETAQEFFRRKAPRPLFSGVAVIDGEEGLRPGSVVEVSGPSGSGKTELLLSLCVSIRADSQSRKCVFIDLDGRLCPARVFQVVKARFGGDTAELRRVLDDIVIARPATSTEFMSLLEALAGELRERPFVLFVDSLAPLFWQDKLALATGCQGSAIMPIALNMLLSLARRRDVVIFTAVPQLFQDQSKGFLPRGWRDDATRLLRLASSPEAANNFGVWGKGAAVKMIHARRADVEAVAFRIEHGGVRFLDASADDDLEKERLAAVR